MATNPASVLTAIHTEDGLVFTGQIKVYWVLAAAGATGGAWQLNDSTDDMGTDLVSGVAAASATTMLNFDPPVQFNTAVYADIPGTNVTLTIGYR